MFLQLNGPLATHHAEGVSDQRPGSQSAPWEGLTRTVYANRTAVTDGAADRLRHSVTPLALRWIGCAIHTQGALRDPGLCLATPLALDNGTRIRGVGAGLY